MSKEKENVISVIEVVKPVEVKEPVKTVAKDNSKLYDVLTSTDLQFFHADRWYVFKAGVSCKVNKTVRDRLVKLKVLEVI